MKSDLSGHSLPFVGFRAKDFYDYSNSRLYHSGWKFLDDAVEDTSAGKSDKSADSSDDTATTEKPRRRPRLIRKTKRRRARHKLDSKQLC